MKVNEKVKTQKRDATPIHSEEKRPTPVTVMNVLALIFLTKSSETNGILLNNTPNDKTPEFKFYIQLNNSSNESLAYNKNNEQTILSTMTQRIESFDRLSTLHTLYFTKQEFNLPSINYSTVIDRTTRNYTLKAKKNFKNPSNFIERTSAKLTSELFLTESPSIKNASLYSNNNHIVTELDSNKLFNSKPFEFNKNRFLSKSMPSILFKMTNNNSYHSTNVSEKNIIISNSKKKREIFSNVFVSSSQQRVKKLRHKFKVLDVKQNTIEIKSNKTPLQKKRNKIMDKLKYSNLRKIIKNMNKNNNFINMTFDAPMTQTKLHFQPQGISIVNDKDNNKTIRFNEMTKTPKNPFNNDYLNKTVFRSYLKRKDLTNITNQSSFYSKTLSSNTMFDSKLNRSEGNQVTCHTKAAKNVTSYNVLFQVEYITANNHREESQSNSNNKISLSDKVSKNKKVFNKCFTIDNLLEKNYDDLDHIDVVMQRTTPVLQINIKEVKNVKAKGEKEYRNSIVLSELMKNKYFDEFLDFDSLYQEDLDVKTMIMSVVTEYYIDKKNDRNNNYYHYDTFMNCSNLADNFLLIRSYTTVDPCRTTFKTTLGEAVSNATTTTTTHKVSDYIIEEKFFSYDVVFATVIIGMGLLLITTAICCCCINMMLS